MKILLVAHTSGQPFIEMITSCDLVKVMQVIFSIFHGETHNMDNHDPPLIAMYIMQGVVYAMYSANESI